MKTIEYNLEEFLQYVDSNPNKLSSGKVSESRTKFTGCETFADALTIAREGVELEKVSELSKVVVNSSRSIETDMVYDVCGSYVDVGLYMTGEPECMVDFVQVESKRFVSLQVGISESSSITATQIINKAAVISALVDTLENSGYRVKVTVNETGSFYKKNTDTSINIVAKHYSDPLAVSCLIGTMHSSFLRRCIFSWIEMNHPYVTDGTVSKSYGKPKEMERPDNETYLIETVCKGRFDYESLPEMRDAYNTMLQEIQDQF